MHSKSFKTALVILAMVVSVAFAAPTADESENYDLNVLYHKYVGENGKNDDGSVVTAVADSDFEVPSEPTTVGNDEGEKPGSADEAPLYQQEESAEDELFDLVFAIPINILKSVNALLNQKLSYQDQQGSAESETLMMFKKKLNAIFNIPITILSSVQNLLNWLVRLA